MARPKGSAGDEKKHKCLSCYDLRQELNNRHKTIARQINLLEMAALRIKALESELRRFRAAKK